jgi:thymidylate synthase ThyX
MKIQYVSICPTEQAIQQDCYSLTPELLAATGARYSRNNEGLDSIVAKIDFSNTDKSVDGIFKMLDYGHASIADMAPLALFIDGISQFAAYYLWTLSPTAGGQECSTRYIQMDSSGTVDLDILGIPDSLQEEYLKFIEKAFKNYDLCLRSWHKLVTKNPELARIPKSLIESNLNKDKNQVARMVRNYAFDRARVYLPVAAKTGVMMVQSARAWANISANLQSHPLKELKLIGEQIAEQMSIGAPRLLKHTKPTDSLKNYLDLERQIVLDNNDHETILDENVTEAYFSTEETFNLQSVYKDACQHRTNRYSPFGSSIARTSVKFAWNGISFGEIRDLNRHRTGTKYCPLLPVGFYGSTDQIPENCDGSFKNFITETYKDFESTTIRAREILKEYDEYIYFTSLGHKYYFEHTTTADKFLYEMELRTGVGAHYKYAEHCKDILNKWYEKFPETQGIIFEGSAEPE